MHKSIALIGSPNCGKTSLFNALTGLNHKVGNFPGVTVDKKTGTWQAKNNTYEVIDLPGTYSIYPKSPEEKVVIDYLSSDQKPDVIVVVIDQTNFRRNLLLLSQIADLKLPVVAALNMSDLAKKQGIKIDIAQFEELTNIQAISINARNGDGIQQLPTKIEAAQKATYDFIGFDQLKQNLSDYFEDESQAEGQLKKEIKDRYIKIDALCDKVFTQTSTQNFNKKIDNVLLHPFWGYVVFFGLLGIIFQLLFTVSSVPMDFIDETFSSLQSWILSTFGKGPFVRLLAEGIVAGVGGVVIFIPQIAFLFFFLGILEETGYMARVVFLMDKWMSKIGMSGRSVVPMISASACAIPAVMGARTITSYKERMITIFVSPLVSCSARLPVYAVFIAIVIPNGSEGFFGLQGLLLLALYLLGFAAAVLTALLMHLFMKLDHSKSLFALELPEYRIPKWSNIAITVYEKSSAFVIGAGKIILAISIILWVLASYGPGKDFDTAPQQAAVIGTELGYDNAEIDNLTAQLQLEHSYIGKAGHFIEPIIKPLGYDWKMGIGLIASFAAREVFVGTLSTIYSIGSEDEGTISEKLQNTTDPTTGAKVYTVATAVSLLVFYVFAMQCMATLAIVKRETNSWKWPLAQVIYMGALAYIGAWLSYIALS